MKDTLRVDRRFFLRTAAVTLAATPALLGRVWANSGHAHENEKSSQTNVMEEMHHGQGAAEPAHGRGSESTSHGKEAGGAAHEEKKGEGENGHHDGQTGHGDGKEEASHGNGKEEAGHGDGKEEASHGHGAEEAPHGGGMQGMEGAGHGGHAHGKEAFKKYGLVRAEKGFKEYNLKLSQYRFTPDTLRVDVGDRVRLNLDSVDATHGFYIDGYGLKTLVPEKENKTFEFVADRAGAFRMRCASTCGPFHPFMIGRFVVGQSSLFWWGVAATVFMPAAVLIGLGWKEDKTHES